MSKENVKIVDKSEVKTNIESTEPVITRKKVVLGNDKEDILKLDTLPKVKDMSKKEVETELKGLEKLAGTQTSQLAETEYPIKVENENYLKDLMKFVEKDLPWQHRNASLLVSVYIELRNAKKLGIDKDGNIWILGKDVAHLYNSLAQRTGEGFFSAKKHVRLITILGETLSESMKMVADDNQILRDIHTRLTELDKRKQEILIEESGVEVEDVEKTKKAAEKIDKAKEKAEEVLEKVEAVKKD